MQAKYLVAIIVGGFSLLGCANGGTVIVPVDGKLKFTGNPSDRQATFIVSEYAPYAEKGDSGILGQVMLRLAGGKVAYGAHSEVVLNPVTSYSTEWFTKSVVGGEWLGDGDVRADTYSRTTTTDPEGRFRFDQLPPGEYYLACQMTSSTENDPRGSNTKLGSGTSVSVFTKTAYATVRVGAREIATVVVTR